MDLWISFRYFQCECGGTIREPLDTLQIGTKQKKLLSTAESTWCPKKLPVRNQKRHLLGFNSI